MTNTQAWNRFSYVINNPVKYTDPTGHRFCDWDPEIGGCSEDPVYPDIDWHPLDDSSIYDYDPPIERDLDGIGGRVEITAGMGIAADANLDFVCLFDKFECGLFVTPGYEEGFEGGIVVSGGPLFIFNMDDLDDYAGFSVAVGGNATAGVGLEAELAFGSEQSDGTLSRTYYLGLSGGAMVGAHFTFGDTFHIFGSND